VYGQVLHSVSKIGPLGMVPFINAETIGSSSKINKDVMICTEGRISREQAIESIFKFYLFYNVTLAPRVMLNSSRLGENPI
jgi:hypothetical protein